MRSSNTRQLRLLARISNAQARRFLEELANLPDSNEGAARFEKWFGDFVPVSTSIELGSVSADDGVASSDTSRIVFVKHPDRRFLDLRERLRQIWAEPDTKTKEWMIFLFRLDPTMSVDMMSFPPPPTGFQQSVIYLLKNADKTRVCGNPKCRTPYFWASRTSQKFCNEHCALPAQRQSKLRWWKENGREWRESNKKKQRTREKVKIKPRL
jgi:hypothetical protein